VPGAAAAVTGALDVGAVLRWRDHLASPAYDEKQAEWLEDTGAVVVRGHGRIVGPRRVDVALPDGGVRALEATKAVVLATGSSATIPPIDGLRDAHPFDSRAITTAERVPERLLVLGGGVVGVEMAQAWKRLGAREVTVIDTAPRLVTQFEPFVSEELCEAFEAEGIAVVLDASVTRAAREGDRGPVTLTLDDGRTFTADEVLVATGRQPNTTDVGIDAIGLEPGEAVEVDDQLRAKGVDGDWLYAIGDCNGRVLLTHMGKYQARIAADAILHGSTTTAWADHRAVPSVVFTDPQLAMVGLTEAKAREQGIDVKVVSFGTGDVSGATVRGNDIEGTCQLVIDDARRVVVGATFTGPGVGEMLHAATIAVAGEVPLDTLWHAVPSFPTMSEVWLRLLEEYGL
jgi:pyruvate/2-oxoglutarate dehydrogenase complex dihydrolipoamide dehydrogenase (E3) component